jgi:hypothetical protein
MELHLARSSGLDSQRSALPSLRSLKGKWTQVKLRLLDTVLPVA